MRRVAASWLMLGAGMLIVGSGCSDDPGADQEGDGEGAGEPTKPGGSGGPAATGGGGAGPGSRTSAAGTGGGGSDGSSGGSSTSGMPDPFCIGDDLLAYLERDHVMVGARLSDELAASTRLDLRNLLLSGLLPDGASSCSACDATCTTNGLSCASADGGCVWWGCEADDGEGPGALVRDFAATARAAGQIPMVTYELLVPSSGADAGLQEIFAVRDAAYLRRYLADFRLVLQSLEGGPALVQVEPGLWGYAQQVDADPHAIAAAVPQANPEDCSGDESTLAGLGQCLVRMARIHGPAVRIGLHASPWATGSDSLQNETESVDVTARGARIGMFLAAVAPDADLVFVDGADHDAGYNEQLGRDTWWDQTNETLPSFHQAFEWSRGVSEALGRPNLWWQLPFGDASLSGVDGQWHDNRVDYFLTHMDEVADAHGVGVTFGAGDAAQVTAETDGGNFASQANAYGDAGGQALCP